MNEGVAGEREREGRRERERERERERAREGGETSMRAPAIWLSGIRGEKKHTR